MENNGELPDRSQRREHLEARLEQLRAEQAALEASLTPFDIEIDTLTLDIMNNIANSRKQSLDETIADATLSIFDQRHEPLFRVSEKRADSPVNNSTVTIHISPGQRALLNAVSKEYGRDIDTLLQAAFLLHTMKIATEDEPLEQLMERKRARLRTAQNSSRKPRRR